MLTNRCLDFEGSLTPIADKVDTLQTQKIQVRIKMNHFPGKTTQLKKITVKSVSWMQNL